MPRSAERAEKGDTKLYILAACHYISDECLEWPFSRFENGYGKASWEGRITTVSRVVCRLKHGEPPTPQHEAAHSCGNSPCFNWQHLSWKTTQENADDRRIHGTVLRGSAHPNAKLTDPEVMEIRASPDTYPVIAARFGIHVETVYCIRARKLWPHL